MTPPRLAVFSMRVLLPRHLREAIIGDLEEEWNAAARPSRFRYWGLALRSIAACWMDRASRVTRLAQAPPLRRGEAMESLAQDLRYGWRSLGRSPGYTAAALLTLALGIGANSAVFSLLSIVSLEPLPYRDPSRVAFVLGWNTEEGSLRFNLSLADYLDLRLRARSLESLAAYSYASANLTGDDLPERVQAYHVTANTFALLGVPAALGRTFGSDESREGHDDVVVLSHGLWQRLFAGDPAIVGRRVTVNGRPHDVMGVMPPGFEFPVFNFKGDLWMPWSMSGAARGQPAAAHAAVLVGRLRPGVSYEQAQADLGSVMASLAREHPQTNHGVGVRVLEMGRLDDEEAGPAMAILLVTMALVLALACANVAHLMLARGVSRHRELAVRAALGATRWRIARQLLVEGLLLAMAGGAAGVVLAGFALRALRSALPEMVLTTMPNVDEMDVDRLTLAYTLAVSVLTSLLFGLVPAVRAARGEFQGGLRETASAGGSRSTRRLRAVLVVAEVALSTLLVVGAGLLARSYRGLQRVSPGFSSDRVVTMTLSLPEYRYGRAPEQRAFYEQALEGIRSLSGVRSAGFVNVLPFSTYDRGTRLVVQGAPSPPPGREPDVAFRVASPGYLETLRVPILEGRGFDARDHDAAAPVALVNRALASRFLGAQPAVGRHVRLGGSDESPWLTIVGVVGNVHHSQLTDAPAPEVYVPLAQSPAPMMMLAVRGDGGPEELARTVRAEILRLDPEQPVYHVKTMQRLVADSLLTRSTSAAFMTLFAALALLLAAVGIYGVVAYSVTQQTREFGLRIALGAGPRDLLSLVLRHGFVLVAAGVAMGMLAALAASRLMAVALYGIAPSDPQTYASAAILLAATGLFACGLPAWRASRVQPLAALREE